MSFFRKLISKTNIYVCNLFWLECTYPQGYGWSWTSLFCRAEVREGTQTTTLNPGKYLGNLCRLSANSFCPKSDHTSQSDLWQIAEVLVRNHYSHRTRALLSQLAAEGGKQKRVGHWLSFSVDFWQPFSRFWSLFGNLFLVFGFLLAYRIIPFCLPPFAAQLTRQIVLNWFQKLGLPDIRAH